MASKADTAHDRLHEMKTRLLTEKETRDRWIGVFIGVVAMFMAVTTMLGNNATKDATRLNIEASNTWAFFQAKNLRRQLIRLQADQLEMDLSTNTALPEATRAAYRARAAEYRALEKRLTTEPERREGLDELFAKGKQLEAERDLALKKDPYFDWAQTLLQISIVLATVCLITGTLWLLYVSGAMFVAGVLLLVNGKLLLLNIPFIG